MKIVIGNDHGAIELKKRIIAYLEKNNFEYLNIGVDSPESVDYPDIAEKACKIFLAGGYDYGIICCGTGIGISISANKINGIRCSLPQDSYATEMTKKHNNPNFLAFGGRIEYKDKIEDMLDIFFRNKFEGGRHKERIRKMMALEKKKL